MAVLKEQDTKKLEGVSPIYHPSREYNIHETGVAYYVYRLPTEHDELAGQPLSGAWGGVGDVMGFQTGRMLGLKGLFMAGREDMSLLEGIHTPMILSKIQDSISDLSARDYRALKEWMQEEEDFDREIDAAVTSGKLDVLAAEVETAEAQGSLSEL